MIRLGFTVTFHSPFRVGAAYASDGVGAALDHADPLPADHLKGIMRAAAGELLGVAHPAVSEVFGSHRTPSPWAWSSAWAWSPAEPSAGWDFGLRHRVAIDDDTHSARKEALVLGEQAWTARARFEVTRAGVVPEDRVDQDVLVLRCAAAGVHGLGAWRRRGLGWVGIRPDDGLVSADEVSRLLSIRSTQSTRSAVR